MKFNAPAVLILFTLLTSLAWAESLQTEVLQTRRNAAELAQVLRPLVATPGSVNHFRNQLIIRAEAAELEQIKAVLKKLDKPLSNLLISVRFSEDAEVRRDLARARARARLIPGSAAAKINLEHSTSTRTGNEVHSLRVLEGQPAFVRTGVSVPMGQEQTFITGNTVSTSRSLRFEEFGSGFYVRATLVDDEVLLDISPNRRQLEGSANAINSARVQEAGTRIKGPLGYWMEVAGVDSSAHRRAQGLANSRLRTTLNESRIFVKVVRLNL